MSKNPLQFCKVDVNELNVGKPKTLDLGFGARSLIYGQKIRPRIEVQAGQLEISLSGLTHEVLGALLLKSSGEATRFITVSADHKIFAWDLQGANKQALASHKRRILGVWELSGNRLVSWGEDKKLAVWNTEKAKLIVEYRTRARSLEHVLVAASGDHVLLTERWWKSRVVDARQLEPGERRPGTVTLPWQTDALTGALKLKSGSWITLADTGIKLWGATGNLLRVLPKFSLDDGYIEYPSPNPLQNRLLVISDAHSLLLLSASGAGIGTRAADDNMSAILKRYSKSLKLARDAAEAKPALTVTHFGFRNNPVCDGAAAVSDSAKKIVPSADAAAPDSLWHFFYRPRYEGVRSWLRPELSAALDAHTRADDAIRSHQRGALRAQRFANVALTALSIPLTMALSAYNRAALLQTALCLALVLIGLAVWQRGLVSTHRAAELVFGGLKDHVEDLVQKVEAARATIRTQLPSIVRPDLYTTVAIRAQTRRVISDLSAAALRACELTPADLITRDRKPIVFRDWSLLLTGDAAQLPNAESFWWTSDGAFVPAVERIQFVLLTQRSLFVYSVDFDFIAKKALAASLHTLYYNDVVDIIIRDLTRPIVVQGVSAEVSAKQLELRSEAGERLAVIGLHETSLHKLRGVIETTMAVSMANGKRNLEAELAHVAQAHKDVVRAERSALELESLAGTPADKDRRGVDEAFHYIKQQIRTPGVGEPKSGLLLVGGPKQR